MDIQTIATEIAKLRCFLTLVIEEDVVDDKDNRGIKPLPNLDFKFVTANTLIGLPQGASKGQSSLLEDTTHIDALQQIRDEFFTAPNDLRNELKNNFYRLQKQMFEATINRFGGTVSDRYSLLSGWDPFEHKATHWFDSEWMFGLNSFDIVIGNPPYGAKFSTNIKDAERLKKYFKSTYQSTKTINSVQKGSLDTFSLFTEKGYDLLSKNGTLVYIVPLSIVTSDSITGLHRILFNNCEMIRVSNYAKRPVQIFNSALTANTIILFTKTFTPTKELWTTKLNRLSEAGKLQELIDSLQFTNGLDHQLNGRIPKISHTIEDTILNKLFDESSAKIHQLQRTSGDKIYYRSAGGRYFNVITDSANGLSSEKSITFESDMISVIGTILSSTLFWWYQQVYTDCLNLKSYEIGQFPIPVAKLDENSKIEFKQIWKQYSDDIERNAEIQITTTSTTYKVSQFKVYKLRKSKSLIDKIDSLVCNLYGFTKEETDFIKNYEIQFRTSNDD